ncbi:MAG: hypothetical protein JO321_15940 [Solirubrobacterales bacterium]|nr:hypothetical protein [Solirubrobacterales bacterium]MBV9168332.1 hypothetical protein [Solirubrobacterales bacterium]MBV9536891.1 hypothetical protein [Solirubrobacterales bacterium]
MFEEDPGDFSIADKVRSMAKEVGGSLERMLDNLELDEPAASFGIDPERAREWAEMAGAWLRSHVEEAGDELASWVSGRGRDEEPDDAPFWEERAPHAPEESPFRSPPRRVRPPEGESHGSGRDAIAHPGSADPLRGAAPNPLDLPTTEQGQALAALDSGRWTLEPGTETLASSAEGPAPTHALGLVRELRVRDWISPDGELTLAGRRALTRWLNAVG